MSPLRGALRQGRLPGSCVERACAFVYAYEAFGHTYMGCMQRVFDVEIDLDLLRAAERRRERLRCGRGAQGPAADVPRRGRVVLRAARRRGRLPQSRVLRDAGREPELPRLRAARRLTPAAACPARLSRSPGMPAPPASLVQRPQSCELGRVRPMPVRPGVSRIAGSSWNAGWARNVCRPSPMSPRRPTRDGRGSSRAALRVVDVQAAQPVEPDLRVESATAASRAAASVTSTPERTSGTSRGRRRAADGGRARRRSRRARRSSVRSCRRCRRILDQEPEVVGRQLEQLAERRTIVLEAGLEACAEMRADVEDDALGPDPSAVSSVARIAATDFSWITGSGEARLTR